jgi:integrase
MHGLRKLVGRRLAEAGCSAMEIQAILGHSDLRNAEIYVRAANKAKLAKAAMARVIAEA